MAIRKRMPAPLIYPYASDPMSAAICIWIEELPYKMGYRTHIDGHGEAYLGPSRTAATRAQQAAFHRANWHRIRRDRLWWPWPNTDIAGHALQCLVYAAYLEAAYNRDCPTRRQS